MPDQIPEPIKAERAAALTSLQQGIRKKILDRQIGREADVLFETYKNGIAYGHTADFIEVAVPSPVALHAQIHRIRIEENDGTQCMGHILSDEKGE